MSSHPQLPCRRHRVFITLIIWLGIIVFVIVCVFSSLELIVAAIVVTVICDTSNYPLMICIRSTYGWLYWHQRKRMQQAPRSYVLPLIHAYMDHSNHNKGALLTHTRHLHSCAAHFIFVIVVPLGGVVPGSCYSCHCFHCCHGGSCLSCQNSKKTPPAGSSSIIRSKHWYIWVQSNEADVSTANPVHILLFL